MGDKRVLDEPVAGKPENTQPAEGRLRQDAYGQRIDQNNVGSDNSSQQGSATTTEVANPYQHIQRALALYDSGDPTRQNAKSAEVEWHKAIEVADKLPTDQYKAKLAEVETLLKTESNPLESQSLLTLKQGLQELIDLPVLLRVQMARFYLQNAKSDEAGKWLEEAKKLNPAIKDREEIGQLSRFAHEYSRDTLDKTIGFLKSTGKELISDGIAGGAGLAAFSLIPGGRLLKVGSALVAGGATKHTLALAGLGGDAGSPLKNFAWGGVDALAMVSGAAVRQRMMTTFEQSITSRSAREMAFSGGIREAEKLAVFEPQIVRRFAQEHMGGYRAPAVLIETGTQGKSGLDALRSVTTMLAENTAAKKAAYRSELQSALAKAPLAEKPEIWLRDRLRVFGVAPRESLPALHAANAEYLAARGSGWQKFNPLNMFRSPGDYNGTLKHLEAITFWNRYKMDAVGIAGSSFVYRGSHEAMKVGDVDTDTGKRYSAYDAITNTLKNTGMDAVSGAFLSAGFRSLGGALIPKVAPVGRFVPEPVRVGLAAVPTAGVLFGNELHEAYVSYDEAWKYENVLAEVQKPLADKPPSTKPKSTR